MPGGSSLAPPCAGGILWFRGPVSDGAAVVTLTVAVAALLPFSVNGLGETVHVASDGAPLQLRVNPHFSPAFWNRLRGRWERRLRPHFEPVASEKRLWITVEDNPNGRKRVSPPTARLRRRCTP
jgi:hypothetical protein